MGFLDFIPIIGDIFGAGSSIASAGMSLDATRETNAANERMNEANIRNARYMMGLSHGFTERMWNKANEYNSPSAQKDRLAAAGLNPYFAMSGQGAATANSVSGVSGSTPSMIPMQPHDYSKGMANLNNSIRGLVASLQYLDQKENRTADTALKVSQANLLDAQAHGQGISNNWADQFNAQGVKELQKRIGLLDAQTEGQSQANLFGRQTHDYYMQELKDNARIRALTEEKLRLDIAMARDELPRMRERHRAELAQISQAIKESRARAEDFRQSGNLKMEQRETEIQKGISQRLDNALKDYSKVEQAEIRNFIYNTYEKDSYSPGLMNSGLSFGNLPRAGFETARKLYKALHYKGN